MRVARCPVKPVDSSLRLTRCTNEFFSDDSDWERLRSAPNHAYSRLPGRRPRSALTDVSVAQQDRYELCARSLTFFADEVR